MVHLCLAEPKFYISGPGHMTKMVPMYGKNFKDLLLHNDISDDVETWHTDDVKTWHTAKGV